VNRYQEADLATWMPGNQPGEPISSPFNPVLY
jgi:hypothetical protein